MKGFEHIVLETKRPAPLSLAPLETSRPTPGTAGLRPARQGSRSPLRALLVPGLLGRWLLLRCAEGGALFAVATVFTVALCAWWGS